MFTMDNTSGYSQDELDELNEKLAERLAKIDPEDTDLLVQTEKWFADEIAQRAA